VVFVLKNDSSWVTLNVSSRHPKLMKIFTDKADVGESDHFEELTMFVKRW